MSDFLSQIQGFNTKAKQNIENNNEADDGEFEGVDFCVGDTEVQNENYTVYDTEFNSEYSLFGNINETDEYTSDEFYTHSEDIDLSDYE